MVAAGIYTNDFTNVTRPMTIEASGGRVALLANGALLQDKGIIVTTSSLTVKGLTLQGAAISDALGGNGAGIRDQSTGATTLRVENTTFLNNQDGILTGGSGNQETVEIIGSSFIGNGSDRERPEWGAGLSALAAPLTGGQEYSIKPAARL
jgi:hypothetical protein